MIILVLKYQAKYKKWEWSKTNTLQNWYSALAPPPPPPIPPPSQWYVPKTPLNCTPTQLSLPPPNCSRPHLSSTTSSPPTPFRLHKLNFLTQALLGLHRQASPFMLILQLSYRTIAIKKISDNKYKQLYQHYITF